MKRTLLLPAAALARVLHHPPSAAYYDACQRLLQQPAGIAEVGLGVPCVAGPRVPADVHDRIVRRTDR